MYLLTYIVCRCSKRFNKQFYLTYPNSNFVESLDLIPNNHAFCLASVVLYYSEFVLLLLSVRLSVLLRHLQSEARLYVPPARRTQGGRADHVPALRQVRLPGAQHLLQAPETVQEQGVT